VTRIALNDNALDLNARPFIKKKANSDCLRRLITLTARAGLR
jgi:hypothetical protein